MKKMRLRLVWCGIENVKCQKKHNFREKKKSSTHIKTEFRAVICDSFMKLIEIYMIRLKNSRCVTFVMPSDKLTLSIYLERNKLRSCFFTRKIGKEQIVVVNTINVWKYNFTTAKKSVSFGISCQTTIFEPPLMLL